MIDYAIVSTNNNNFYKDFWPVVKYAWNTFINCKPVLIEISDRVDFTEYDDCVLVKYKEVKGIDTGFQAQIARIYATSLFYNYSVILSDIDMIPLNKDYFQSVSIDKNEVVLYSGDWHDECWYPLCYVAGYGQTLDKVFDLNCSWDNFVHRLHERGHGWGGDQEYISHKLLELNSKKSQIKITKLERGWINNQIAKNRIDRDCLEDIDNYVNIEKYIDFHCPRPYTDNTNKHFIDSIIHLKNSSINNDYHRT